MDASSWVGVFQRIPPDKEDFLMIVTTSGVEIVIQKIIRIDAEFLILKGRISGAMDAARAVLMPYNQINNLCVNKQLQDADILTVFGCDGGSERPVSSPPKAETNTHADEAPVEHAAPFPEPPLAPAAAPILAQPSSSRGSAPSKSIFLQRLRARLGAAGPGSE